MPPNKNTGRPIDPRALVLLVSFALLLNYIDRGNLATAAPLVKQELGLDAAQIGFLMSAFYWSYVALMVPVGWATERFGALASEIRARRGLASLVTWGPGEEDLARQVERASGGAARPAPATASLLDLAEIPRRAGLFVSGDTGPMHLAAACGTPCVALFGPKDPAVYRPWGSGHAVLRGAGRGGRLPAMDEIEVPAVVEAVLAALERPRAAH